MTTWTRAALTYERHLAELENARAQYEQASSSTMTRLRSLIGADLGLERIVDDTSENPGLGRQWLHATILLANLEVAVVHAWLGGAYSGAAGTLTVAVEGKSYRAPAIGWNLDVVKRAADALGWQRPDLALAANADLHEAEIADTALCLHRFPLGGDGDPVLAAAGALTRLVAESSRLVDAVQESAPTPWSTYLGIIDAARELRAEGLLVAAPSDLVDWKGMAYVTISGRSGKVGFSVKPTTGQLILSRTAKDEPVSPELATSTRGELIAVGGYPSLLFPEPQLANARSRARELVIDVARAHL